MKKFLRLGLCLLIILSSTVLRADEFNGEEAAVNSDVYNDDDTTAKSYNDNRYGMTEKAGNYTGAELHDGFFLRFLLGYGKASMTEKDVLGSDFTLSGTCNMFKFQLGAAPVDNFILYGELSGVSVPDPDIKWRGYSAETKNTTFGINDPGFGFCYYIMPANFYLSAGVSFPLCIIEDNTGKYGSKRGTGFNYAIGKEWWVSDNWGLGIAFTGSIFKTTDSDDGCPSEKQEITGWYWGICFSATYN